jgi:hypothetical protein
MLFIPIFIFLENIKISIKARTPAVLKSPMGLGQNAFGKMLYASRGVAPYGNAALSDYIFGHFAAHWLSDSEVFNTARTPKPLNTI